MANDATIIQERINQVPIIEISQNDDQLFMNQWGIVIAVGIIITIVAICLSIIIMMYYRYTKLQE